MISVVVVDDEYFVRVGVKAAIEWHKSDYIVVGEAENGAEACAIVLEQMPDLVLLDIAIPGMNGLDVLKHVREQGYAGYITILTSHESFQYAQTALRLGANDYILKTDLTGQNILDYLNQIKWPQPSGDSEKYHEQAMREEKRHNFLINVMRVGFDNEDLDSAKERFVYRLGDGGVYLALVKIRDYESVVKRYEASKPQILSRAVFETITEAVHNIPEYEVVKYSFDIYALLATFSNEVSEAKCQSEIRRSCQIIERNTKEFLHVETTIAVQFCGNGLTDVHASFVQAMSMLNLDYFFPQKSLYWNIGRQYKADSAGTCLSSLKRRLEVILSNKMECSSADIVDEWVQICGKKHIAFSRAELQFIIRDFLAGYAETLGKEAPLVNDGISYQELLNLLNKFDDIAAETYRPSNYLVAQAITYINLHFTESMHLTDLAELLEVSASHISRVFSKETGKPFQTYLAERRIEYAKELIVTTNLKHYEISDKCGFQSPIHFSNMFKRVTGMTPNQYRNKSI